MDYIFHGSIYQPTQRRRSVRGDHKQFGQYVSTCERHATQLRSCNYNLPTVQVTIVTEYSPFLAIAYQLKFLYMYMQANCWIPERYMYEHRVGHAIMRGDRGPTNQLQDLDWDAFNQSSRAPQLRSYNYNIQDNNIMVSNVFMLVYTVTLWATCSMWN